MTITLSTLGKIFSRRHIEIFFLFFQENRFRHFMQIVSSGDNLHEMPNPIFWGKIRTISICHLTENGIWLIVLKLNPNKHKAKNLFSDFTIETMPAPGSGPVLLSIMNILEGYDLKQDNVSYHKILEAFKFGYANREKLADPIKDLKEPVLNASKTMIR